MYHSYVKEFDPICPDETSEATSEHDCALRCCQCVADQSNRNLSGPQKELLLWHTKLCLNMQDLQELMKPHQIKDQSGRVVATKPEVIPTK